MKIIGFNIYKIVIERKNPVKDQAEIKSDLSIEDIKEEEIPISDKKSLKIDFSFGVDYRPDIARLEMKGSVLALEEKGEFKDILKDWKKKKLSAEFKIPLFNFILSKCNVKAIGLEDEMGLPIHIPFPQLSAERKAAAKEDKPNYTR